MKTYYLLPILLMFNLAYSQQVDLINENFDNGIPTNWTHCSTNWGTSPVWAVDSGALKEASGWYFVATSNMFTLPAVDLTLISNPILEFDLAMAITDTNIQLSVWWTNDTTCNQIWDTINNQWLLDSSWTLISTYGSSTSGASNVIPVSTALNNNWTPLSTDYQTISIDLTQFANESNIRFSFGSDYLNYGASGVWSLDNIKIFGTAVGQTSQIDCSLLELADVAIDDSSMTIDITIYNGDTVHINYPYIGLVVDAMGDTIQNGSSWIFVQFAGDSVTYSYTLNNVSPIYPLTVYFAYSDMVGGMGTDTCVLATGMPLGIYEPRTTHKQLLYITDILGRTTHPTSNTLLFYLYDDGSVEKRIQLER